VSADLAMSFHAAGNIAARELALEQAAAAQADGAARGARNTALDARAELQRLLGIAPDLTWRVPDTLPLPVAEEDSPAAMQAMAGEQRLDLAASRGLVELLAANTRDTEKYRWLGTLDVGVAYERETDRSRLLGPTLSVQLPLFGGGKGDVAHAQALQDWSEAEQRRLTLEVADAVDLASRRVLSAREQVEDYRTGLIPQREAVVSRTQEEVNFMLRGVFDLIAVKQQEYDARESYVQALRDYWIARCELELAVGARWPSEAGVASARVSANAPRASADAGEGEQP
jgi:cobalt-zinc-cadmium efflux system outer membrane protein